MSKNNFLSFINNIIIFNIISYVIDNEENKVIYSKNDDKIIKDIDQIKSDEKFYSFMIRIYQIK